MCAFVCLCNFLLAMLSFFRCDSFRFVGDDAPALYLPCTNSDGLIDVALNFSQQMRAECETVATTWHIVHIDRAHGWRAFGLQNTQLLHRLRWCDSSKIDDQMFIYIRVHLLLQPSASFRIDIGRMHSLSMMVIYFTFNSDGDIRYCFLMDWSIAVYLLPNNMWHRFNDDNIIAEFVWLSELM